MMSLRCYSLPHLLERVVGVSDYLRSLFPISFVQYSAKHWSLEMTSLCINEVEQGVLGHRDLPRAEADIY